MKAIRAVVCGFAVQPIASHACFDGAEYARSFASADPVVGAAFALLGLATAVRAIRTEQWKAIPAAAALAIAIPLVYTRYSFDGDCGFRYVDTAHWSAALVIAFFLYESFLSARFLGRRADLPVDRSRPADAPPVLGVTSRLDRFDLVAGTVVSGLIWAGLVATGPFLFLLAWPVMITTARFVGGDGFRPVGLAAAWPLIVVAWLTYQGVSDPKGVFLAAWLLGIQVAMFVGVQVAWRRFRHVDRET